MKSFSDPFCRNISVVTTSIDWRFPTVFYRKSQKHVRFHSTTWSTTCLFVKTCLLPNRQKKGVQKSFGQSSYSVSQPPNPPPQGLFPTEFLGLTLLGEQHSGFTPLWGAASWPLVFSHTVPSLYGASQPPIRPRKTSLQGATACLCAKH